MMRQINRLRYMGWALASAVAVAVTLAAPNTFAQGLQYQDADELTVDPALGRPNVAPVSAFKSNLPVVDNDSLWNYRDFGVGAPGVPTVYQSGLSEDSPMLTQTVTGLTPGNSYDLYAVYWTDEDENWTIRTGTNTASMNFYSWNGADGGRFPVAGSTQGIAAATAPWTTLPPSTKDPNGAIFIEPRDPFDPLVMVLGKAGTATANASGEIDVFVDDNPNAGGPRRSWFDGVAFVEAGIPLTVSASLDRSTGALSITNSTSQALQITGYQITHADAELAANPQSGTVNSNNWTTVSSTNPSWTVTSPATPSDFATLLAESGTAITIPANGGSLNFGNVWNKSPLDHLLVRLTLADNSVAVLAPSHTGPAIANGDLDANGVINVSDFQAFLNGLHTSPGLTRVENYRLGEMTNNGVVDFADWVAFRAAYNAANGSGTFEAMLTSIPEPTSGVIMVIMAGLLCGVARRRSRFAGALLVVCLFASMSTSAFALDIKVDLDSMRTSGTDAAGPIATQSGFTSWDLTNVGTEGSMLTVDGITFEIFGLNAVNQSRIRLTGTTPNGGGGEFNDLLADFVYNEGADGRAVGLRITGLPVGEFNMQSWHHDFGVGTPEATQVEVRNQGGAADILETAVPWATSPIQFMFDVTEANQVKEVIFRESSTGNRARLNGFTLSDFAPPPPVELTLRVNTTTGAMSIVNEQDVSFNMNYYEIRSATGALNPAGWTSLDDAENSDPVGSGWDEAPASSASLLSEVNLESMTSFAPGHLMSLGDAFTLGGDQNLQFFYAGPGSAEGDYNSDGAVDAADYISWRKALATGAPLPNDPTPGTTADDYNVWRANFGSTAGPGGDMLRTGNISYVTGAGAGLASTATVPEPGAAILGAIGMGLMLTMVLRKRVN